MYTICLLSIPFIEAYIFFLSPLTYSRTNGLRPTHGTRTCVGYVERINILLKRQHFTLKLRDNIYIWLEQTTTMYISRDMWWWLWRQKEANSIVRWRSARARSHIKEQVHRKTLLPFARLCFLSPLGTWSACIQTASINHLVWCHLCRWRIGHSAATMNAECKLAEWLNHKPTTAPKILIGLSLLWSVSLGIVISN